ncbi:transmembrane protein, putative [Medicago truncatula]|uniref:Transmembrane protein, putative n=1 Tax=Medicago truncatula TaxID=3880 RepID=A0A072V8G4_MEDTR|nr:transmembrane protein, putative [Medicago truncatula]
MTNLYTLQKINDFEQPFVQLNPIRLKVLCLPQYFGVFGNIGALLVWVLIHNRL